MTGYNLLSQFPGPRARTHSQKSERLTHILRNEQYSYLTVRLDLWSKTMSILNKIPKIKWKSNNNDWKRLQLLKF
mgnify:CR=1 FL=1